MLFIPIATTFRYRNVMETFGYCYPNREWYIQEPRPYDPWDTIIPDITEEMDGFRFVPTTIRQTNRKLKDYLKKKQINSIELPERMTLRYCYTYGMTIDNHNRCFYKVVKDDISKVDLELPHTKVEPNSRWYGNRPIYNDPKWHISVANTIVEYVSRDGTQTWWYRYEDLDDRKFSDHILKSVHFEVNCLVFERNEPKIVRWFLCLKYDPDRKEIIWDEEKCFKAILLVNRYQDTYISKPYTISNATPFGPTELDIDAVYGASATNATKLVAFLVNRFFCP